MTIRLQSNGAFTGAKSVSAVMRAIVQTQAATVLKAANITDLTDSSTGVAQSVIDLPAELAATAQSGSNLAGKSGFEAALVTVLNGLGEVMAKANAMGTAIGVTAVTDSSGAAATNGTIEAITKTVTGATTGAQVSNTNAVIAGLNDYAATVAEQVNHVCAAVGVSKLRIQGHGTAQSPVSAKSTNTGTAAATNAVSKAHADALLVAYANIVATLAAKLTAANAVSTKPKVLAV